MRIVGGTARGLKLAGPGRAGGIRPTSDKVREALFNMIHVDGCAFLDLFGGTGAVACEAVSRGAESVTIVENSPRALSIIKKNVSLVTAAQGVKAKVELRCADAPKFIAGKTPGVKYDFCFVDPPYDRPDAGLLLEEIIRNSLLKPDGVLILETSSRKVPELKLELEPSTIRRYGDTTLLLFY